jgi:hypothetical protein
MKMGPIRTTITLEQPPQKVRTREMVAFTGRLAETESEKPLINSIVRLYDRDIGKDDLLGEGLTDAKGNYSIQWKVKKVDFLDDAAEVYVKFKGDEEHRASNSKQFTVELGQ